MWFEVADEYYGLVRHDATLIGNLLWCGTCCFHVRGSKRGILTFLKLEAPCELWNTNTLFGAKAGEYIV
jgi:hypothetical protein